MRDSRCWYSILSRWGVALIAALAVLLIGASAVAFGQARSTTVGAAGGYGSWTGSPTPAGSATPGPESVASVQPTVTDLGSGATQTQYVLPDGEQLTVPTPPASFDPLTASNAELQKYDFPLPPTDAAGLQAWQAAMAAYRSDDAPTGALQVAQTAVPAQQYATLYGNWAGFAAGQRNTQSHTFVAVKGLVHVPSVSSCNSNNGIGIWIGLGGTSGGNNLSQQGIECGNTLIGSGGAFRSFTEFANTAAPHAFCGHASWTFAAGHAIYQNMSFQRSSNTAYFYLEDEATGVAHSCSAKPPSGWSYDGNTGDWITEAPAGTAVKFSKIPFSDAEVELDSNSSWVTFGSRTTTKFFEGDSSSHYCIGPSTIGSDNQSFSDNWHQSSCY